MAMLKLVIMMIIVPLRHDHHGGNVEDGDHGDEVEDPKLENGEKEILQ